MSTARTMARAVRSAVRATGRSGRWRWSGACIGVETPEVADLLRRVGADPPGSSPIADQYGWSNSIAGARQVDVDVTKRTRRT